jgi:hypothetical protein
LLRALVTKQARARAGGRHDAALSGFGLSRKRTTAAVATPSEEPEVRPLAGSRLPLGARVVHRQQARTGDTEAVERVPLRLAATAQISGLRLTQ